MYGSAVGEMEQKNVLLLTRVFFMGVVGIVGFSIAHSKIGDGNKNGGGLA